MKELIETIESIGFRELDIDFGSKVFEREKWMIIIHDGHWELAYRNFQSLANSFAIELPSSDPPVSVAHTLIPYDDRKILHKYFSRELREEKLKELGILCDTEISQSEILDDVEIPQKSGI